MSTIVMMFALVIAGNVAGPLLPSSEGELAFGLVSAAVAIVAVVALTSGRRWGYVAALVVAALNLVLAAPAMVSAPTGLIQVVAGVSAAACLAILTLLIRRRDELAPKS